MTADDRPNAGNTTAQVRVPVDALTDIRQTLARIEAALAALPRVIAEYRGDQPIDADYEDAAFYTVPHGDEDEEEEEEDEVSIRLRAALAELKRI